MKEFIPVLLPIIWAIVATIIGLILYRSSEAFFEQSRSGDGNKRRIRIVGSITISALVYLGLWNATPESAAAGFGSEVFVISKNDFNSAITILNEATAAISRIEACTTVTSLSGCGNEISTARNRHDEALRRLNSLRPDE